MSRLDFSNIKYTGKGGKSTAHLKPGLMEYEVVSLFNERLLNNIASAIQKANNTKGIEPTLFDFAAHILKEVTPFSVAKDKYGVKNLIDAKLPDLGVAFDQTNNSVTYQDISTDKYKELRESYERAELDINPRTNTPSITPIDPPASFLQMIFNLSGYKHNAVIWAIKEKNRKQGQEIKKKCYQFGITQESWFYKRLVEVLESLVGEHERKSKAVPLGALIGYWASLYQQPRIHDPIARQKSEEAKNVNKPNAYIYKATDYDVEKFKKETYGTATNFLFLLSDLVPMKNTAQIGTEKHTNIERMNKATNEKFLALTEKEVQERYRGVALPTRETILKLESATSVSKINLNKTATSTNTTTNPKTETQGNFNQPLDDQPTEPETSVEEPTYQETPVNDQTEQGVDEDFNDLLVKKNKPMSR